MEYTKGPWTLEDTGGEFFIPETNVSFLRSHSTNKKEDEGIRKSEQGQIELANARLMTAAPDIYETLRAVKSYLELAGIGQGIYHLVCDALSKAEGRTD